MSAGMRFLSTAYTYIGSKFPERRQAEADQGGERPGGTAFALPFPREMLYTPA